MSHQKDKFLFCSKAILIFSLIVSLGLPTASLTAPFTQNMMQYQQYMKAADGAKEAADTNNVLSIVWGGVGVVCLAACITSASGTTIFSAGTDQWVCIGTNLAASITDAAMTKDLTQSLMSIAGAGANFALKPDTPNVDNIQQAQEALDKAKAGGNAQEIAKAENALKIAKEPKTNWGACLSAAMSILQVFMKRNAMAEQRKLYKENKKLALQLLDQSNTSQAVVAAAPNFNLTPKAGGGGVASEGGATGGVGDTVSGKSAETSPSLASGACSGGSVSNTLTCATSNDPGLPDFVNSQRFQKDFKKASGMDFKNFLGKNSDRASDSFKGALGGVLNQQKADQVAALIDRYEQKFQFMGPVEGSAYAGAGSGGAPGGSQGNAMDPNALVENLLGQLLPKDEAVHANLDRVGYANQTRSPASISEDRSISLFERISYRYQSVVRKILSQ